MTTPRKRYYESKADAVRAAKALNGDYGHGYEVHRQPKGTRHHGMYYVGMYLEWLNFAN